MSINIIFLMHTAELVVTKQSEEKQSDHTIVTSSHSGQQDAATTTLSQHDGNVSASSDGYMEKDSLCTSQSTITSANQLVQDNVLISRSQLRKVLKAEIRKLLVTNISNMYCVEENFVGKVLMNL